LNRDLFADGAMMDEELGPPRQPLGNLWPDDAKVRRPRDAPPISARKKQKTPAGRQHCLYCAGELVRSRIRLYERVLTLVTRKRPYRCVDCRARSWR
jgi:hypothetical protein